MELNDPGAVDGLPGYRFTEDQAEGGPERALGVPSARDVAYLQSIVNATAEANLPLREAVDVLYMDELSPDEDEGGTSRAATTEAESPEGPYYAKTVRLSVIALDAIRRGRGGKYVQALAEQTRDSCAFEAGRVLNAIATQAAAVHCPVPVTEVTPDSPLRDIISAARALREDGYGGALELFLIRGLEGLARIIHHTPCCPAGRRATGAAVRPAMPMWPREGAGTGRGGPWRPTERPRSAPRAVYRPAWGRDDRRGVAVPPR